MITNQTVGYEPRWIFNPADIANSQYLRACDTDDNLFLFDTALDAQMAGMDWCVGMDKNLYPQENLVVAKITVEYILLN